MFPRFKEARQRLLGRPSLSVLGMAPITLSSQPDIPTPQKSMPFASRCSRRSAQASQERIYRKTLSGSPFGWPRDAIDAALIALHRSQHITATLNGAAVPLGQLDQNKISKSEFPNRTDDPCLFRIGWFSGSCSRASAISCKSGDEGICAGEFADKVNRTCQFSRWRCAASRLAHP